MAELFEAVASWPTLLLVLLVFGFAPGFVLRLLVLVYPCTDPRRRELIAELYTVPRIQRPLWVTEQLEVALFEGLAHRIRAIRSITRRRRARVQSYKRAKRLRFASVAVVGVAVGVIVDTIVTWDWAVGIASWIVAVAVAVAVIVLRERAARRRLSARARRRFWP